MKVLFLISIFLVSPLLLSQVNSTVSAIQEDFVSTRDIETHYIVSHALYHYKSSSKQFPMSNEQLRQLGSSYLLELMVYREAKEFGLAEVSRKKIKLTGSKVLARILKSKLADRWKSWQVETTEMDKIIEIVLRSRKLIGNKRRSAEILVTDAEVDAYIKNNSKSDIKEQEPAVRAKVKEFLGQRQGEQRLREWFQVLKAKYKIRVF